MSVRIAFGLNKIDQRRKHAPERILLLRDGDIGWEGLEAVLTEASAKAIIDTFNKQGSDMPIDYHHTTLKVDRGETSQAPAAGFIKSLEFVRGKGLYAEVVEWNEEAAAQIEKREYKYISPVIRHNEDTGEILELHSVALTNKPRTRDQIELLQAAERLEIFTNKEPGMAEKTKTKLVSAQEDGVDEGAPAVDASQMLLTKLISVLQEKGAQLADEAPMAEVIRAALEVLGADVATVDEEPTTEEPASMPTDEKTKASIPPEVALKAASYDKLNDRLKLIEGERKEKRVDTLIEAEIAAGKILPEDAATISAARELAEQNEPAFAKLYAAMAPICEPGRLVSGSPSGNGVSSRRKKLIVAASREFTDNPKYTRSSTMKSWVNTSLRMEGEPLLDGAETNKLEA